MRRLPGVTVSERVAIAEAVAERLGRRRKPVPLWPVAGSCVDRVHSPIQSAAKTDCRYIQISQCGKNRLSECTRIAHGYPENPHECWLIATVHHRGDGHAPGAKWLIGLGSFQTSSLCVVQWNRAAAHALGGVNRAKFGQPGHANRWRKYCIIVSGLGRQGAHQGREGESSTECASKLREAKKQNLVRSARSLESSRSTQKVFQNYSDGLCNALLRSIYKLVGVFRTVQAGGSNTITPG